MWSREAEQAGGPGAPALVRGLRVFEGLAAATGGRFTEAEIAAAARAGLLPGIVQCAMLRRDRRRRAGDTLSGHQALAQLRAIEREER